MSERRDVFFRNGAIRHGINQAIYEKMKEDSMVYIFGEGAVMKVHFDEPRIEKEFSDRVITWPIAEDSGINFSLGASLLGVKPIFDVITADFMFRTMDSICNTCATTNHILGEHANPIVIRGEFMLFAPSTGQRPEAIFGHIPNLNVVIPSNQIDAYYLMQDALGRNQVTVFFEDRMVVDMSMKPEDRLDANPQRPRLQIGQARIRRRGDDLTVASYGLTLQRVESVLDEHPEWDVELIDLATIKPLDKKTLFTSTDKTGMLLVVEPDIVIGGIGAEVVASAVEHDPGLFAFRMGAPLHTIPATPVLHDMVIPNKQRIEQKLRSLLV